MLTSTDSIAIETVDAAAISDEMIGYYYPLISEKRKNEINSLVSAAERCLVLAQEIVARKTLATLNGCSEERITLSVNEDGVMTADRGMGFISIAVCGTIVSCAASHKPCAMGLAPVVPFSFSEAQQKLSDTEIRAVVAASGYSLMDIVNLQQVKKPSVAEFYAKLCALKAARNASVDEKKIKPDNKIQFSFSDGQFTCLNEEITVEYCNADRQKLVALAVVSRNNQD